MSAPTALEVHVEIYGATVLAGIAYLTARRGAVTTRFEYDRGYLTTPGSFDLSPHLRRQDRSATTNGLPGACADSAPDRWGRNLIKRRVQAAARDTRTTPAAITEIDYLCGVSDITRQGALRFRARGGGPFVADSLDVPRLIELPALLAATREVTRGADDLTAVKLLLAAGSASLGGARPKASVRDGDRLAIAKFPHHADDWDVIAWEATMLDLAAHCEITVPHHRLETISGASVLLMDRFDRDGPRRVPYISAMTLLDRTDGQDADYVEIAEAISAHGANVNDDLRQLWRRIAFSVAVNNTDDHLRNHGLLHAAGGWMLAPVFDVNPNPDQAAHRATSVVGATDRAGCLRALLDGAEYFAYTPSAALETWSLIIAAVAAWRGVATANGISVAEQRRFADTLDSVPIPG